VNAASNETRSDDRVTPSPTAEDTRKGIQCDGLKYSLITDRESRIVSIQSGSGQVTTISWPSQSEINGFSLNSVRRMEDTIEISVEYGSRFYFEKAFRFACVKERLLLTDIQIVTFDKMDPETTWK